MRRAERIVNDMIRQNLPLDEHRDTPLEEAKKMGAIALFGEKYGDKVRVVRFGPSCEFCGGIHASATGKIGMFKIVIQKYIDEHDTMKKEIEQFHAQAVERTKDSLLQKAREVNGVKVITAVLPMDAAAAKDLVFKIRQAVPERLLCVIGTKSADKPMLSVMLSDDMVKDFGMNAGQMVREAARLILGGGGGQPHYATAGGKNPDGLSAAVDKVLELAKL